MSIQSDYRRGNRAWEGYEDGYLDDTYTIPMTKDEVMEAEDTFIKWAWNNGFGFVHADNLKILYRKIIEHHQTEIAELKKTIPDSFIKGMLEAKDIELTALKTKLARAEDAAAKGDLARQQAGGMEMEIAALRLDKERLNWLAEFGDIFVQSEDGTEKYEFSSLDTNPLRQQIDSARNTKG